VFLLTITIVVVTNEFKLTVRNIVKLFDTVGNPYGS